LKKLLFCASVVALTIGAIPASQAFAATATAKVPTHKCTRWNYASSSHKGQRAYGKGFIVENDVWNPERIEQKLYSCNFDSFYVQADVHNRDGSVQSYPSSQYTFRRPVKISEFRSLASDFRISGPPTGRGLDYEFAYDIWINGYGGSGHTELMIWTYNHGQRPAGSELRGTIAIDGHRFKAWVAGRVDHGGDIVTFEAINNYTAGDMNLMPFLDHAASKGWLHDGRSTPLWQIDFGAELCATATTTKFDFTDFDVTFKT
jgi:hypothetical protein